MQRITHYRNELAALGAAAVVAVLGACSGSTSPSAVGDSQITQDIASVAANTVAEEASAFGTEDTQSGAAGDVVLAPGHRIAASASAMRPTREMADCTLGSFEGTITFPFSDPRDTLSVDRTWEFFAGGVCQNAFDASTTDSIVFNATVSAELHGVRGFWQAHRDDQRTHWVTGAPTLRGASTHVWNGFGAGVDTSSFNGAGPETRAYVGAAADTVTSVTFPHPRDGALYPISGTFARWVNAMATFSGPTTGSRQIARHLVVTFNGTAIVPIVFYDVSTGAVALTCQLDLSVGDIIAGSCH